VPLLRRRDALVGASSLAASAILLPRRAYAKDTLPPIPLAIQIAWETSGGDKDEAPVVSKAFLDDQIERANAVFGEHGISFVEAAERGRLPASKAVVETRDDRDAFVDSMQKGLANVFLVRSLRDVDDPSLYRMGVTWRNLKNLKKKYVIVAASALTTTLAHELGHFLGNDHTSVKNNLMSYDRDGGKVFLDARQGERSRRTARGLFAKKELVSASG